MRYIYYLIWEISLKLSDLGQFLHWEWLYNLGGSLEYWADEKEHSCFKSEGK